MKNHKYDQKLKVTPTCFFIIPEKKLTLGLKKIIQWLQNENWAEARR